MLKAESSVTRIPNRRRRGRSRGASWTVPLWLGVVALVTSRTAWGQGSGAVARWGQGTALLDSLFIVQGGKTEGVSGGGMSYNSGANSADLLVLDVSAPFPAGIGTVAPWQVVSVGDTSSTVSIDGTTTTPPSVAFGSLAPLTHQQVLLFGGDDVTAAVQTGADSVYTFQLVNSDEGGYAATWQLAPSTWAQPTRSVYSAIESDGRGGAWLLGGQRNDGSMLNVAEAWSFNHSSSSPVFQALPVPTGSIAGGTVTLLSDGTLLLLGGEDVTGALQPFDNVVTYNPATSAWSNLRTRGVNGSSSAVPVPRRGHVAVSLPDQRIFLHGGSSTAELTTALNDAWILDWSVNPPRWTQIPTSNSAPSARFAHSAVAYGRKVLITLGWTGTTSADEAVYVFDATEMSADNDGMWTGGSWSTSYTPDTLMTTASTSIANNPGGNSLSSSSGGELADTNSGGVTSGGSTTTSSASSPTRTGNRVSGSTSTSSDRNGSNGGEGSSSHPTSATNDDGSSNDRNDESQAGGGASSGAKAGAAIGVLLGVGLIITGAYFFFKRRQQSNDSKWQYGQAGEEDGYGGGGGGGTGLLGGAAGMGGYDQTGYGADEKDQYLPPPPHRDGVGAAWSPPMSLFPSFFNPHRSSKRPDNIAALDVYSNLGRSTAPVSVSGGVWAPHHSHAIEGSGPGVRQKLAMLTGLNGWSQPSQQTRFDMLADEDAEAAYGLGEKHAGHDEGYGGAQDRADEYEYGASDYAHDIHYNPEATGDPSDEQAYEYDNYAYDAAELPYEAEQGSYHSHNATGYGGGVAGAAAGILAAVRSASGSHVHPHQPLASEEEIDPNTNYHRYLDAESASAQSDHAAGNTYGRDGRDSSVYSTNPYGLTSIPPGKTSRNSSLTQGSHLYGAGSSGSMKRSSTWWDRVMSGSSLLDRTASGRLAIQPSAKDPIRDPAHPPASMGLSAIRESPRSTDLSEDVDIFADPPLSSADKGPKRKAGPYDSAAEVMIEGGHGRSHSSLQSGTSSHLESRLRGMDVVQRTRTGSGSDMTVSTKKTRHERNSSSVASYGAYSSRVGPTQSGLPLPVEEVALDGEENIDSTAQVSFHAPRYEIGDASQASVVAEPEGLADVSLSAISESDGLGPDESMDIVAQGDANAVHDGSSHSPFDDRYASSSVSRSDRDNTYYHHRQQHPGRSIPRDVSEVPSITPLTTKRARRNPALTSPVRHLPKKQKEDPILGSVKERVEAIEKRKSELLAAVSSVPTSPLGQGSPVVTAATPGIGSPIPLGKFSHGLVPKAQLFVANPDHTRTPRQGS